MNKLTLLSIISLIHVTTATTHASLVETNISWHQQHQTYIEETLKTTDCNAVIPIINTLGLLWQERDGAVSFEVAPTIAIALTHHPQAMLQWFQKHPDQYTQWLEEIPNTLLTDFQGDQQKINQLKQNLIKALYQYTQEPIPTELNALADKMKKQLEKHEIQTIN